MECDARMLEEMGVILNYLQSENEHEETKKNKIICSEDKCPSRQRVKAMIASCPENYVCP